MVTAVIGWPIEHSASPALLGAAFRAAGIEGTMLACAVRPEDLAKTLDAFDKLNLAGTSVTIPHKLAVMTCCDQLDASAQAAGAVNCVVFRNGTRVGHNTDASGYVDALREELSFDPRGKNVCLLGAGGAARAVAAGLAAAGATAVDVITRAPENARWCSAKAWTARQLSDQLPATDLLVDCTSAGLRADSESRLPCPIPLHLLPQDAIVSSLIYHRQTALLREAADRQLRTIDGRGMLLFQGARAFALWTGQEAPLEPMRQALDLHLATR